MVQEEGDPAGLLPLRPVVLGILLSLNDQDRHGYAVMKDVNQRLESTALLGPGTLYRTLKELREQGLIERSQEHTSGEDNRRQYYTITHFGRRVAQAEASRMSAVVEAAKAGGLLA